MEEEEEEVVEEVEETLVESKRSMLCPSRMKEALGLFGSAPGRDVLAANVMITVSPVLIPGLGLLSLSTATAEDMAGQHTCAPSRLNLLEGQEKQAAIDVCAGEKLNVIRSHELQVVLDEAPIALLYVPGGHAKRTPLTQ